MCHFRFHNRILRTGYLHIHLVEAGVLSVNILFLFMAAVLKLLLTYHASTS